jgi:hypothetical protein
VTRQDYLVLVARKLRQPFTAEELTVAAFEGYPLMFGLAEPGRTAPNYRYPDHNKVLTALHGKRGLVARGELEKVGPNLYRVKA